MRIMAGAPAAPPRLPWRIPRCSASYFEKQARLWTALASGKRETLASPEPGDRRFAAKEWRENPYYDYLKQSYLLAARYVEELVDAAQLEPQAEEPRALRRAAVGRRACARRTSPRPIRTRCAQAVATRGESLARGLANLLGDVQQAPHQPDQRDARSRSAAISRSRRARWCSRTS